MFNVLPKYEDRFFHLKNGDEKVICELCNSDVFTCKKGIIYCKFCNTKLNFITPFIYAKLLP